MDFINNSISNFEWSKSGNYIIFGICGALLLTILIYVGIYLYALYYTWKNDSDDLDSWRRDKLNNIKSNEIEQLHSLNDLVDTSMTTTSTKKTKTKTKDEKNKKEKKEKK